MNLWYFNIFSFFPLNSYEKALYTGHAETHVHMQAELPY